MSGRSRHATRSRRGRRTRLTARRLAVPIGLAILSCGDGGTGPDPGGGGGTARLAVSPDSITAPVLGQAVSFSVTLDGRPVTPSLQQRAEQRWLDDLPVLDPAALVAGTILPVAPGRAVVRVTSGTLSDSVIVNVVPARPVVLATRLPAGRTHLGDGDTIVLRGYRMDGISQNNLVATAGATVVPGADSANARIALTTAGAAAGCVGTAPALTIAFTGIDGGPVTGLTQKRQGELALAIGEARRLSDAAVGCLRFANDGNASYLLAYADTRLVERAQSGPEVPWPDSVLVTVENLNGPEEPVRVASAQVRHGSFPWIDAIARPHEPVMAFAPPAGCPFANQFLAFCRTAPYTTGESFLYYPAAGQRPSAQARVLSIQGNLVAAVFTPDSMLLAPGIVAKLDTALARVRDRAIPLLQATFDLSSPVRTSDESGQLLIALESASGSFANWWPDASNGHGRWGRVTLHVDPLSAIGDPATNSTRVLLIAAHEVLHTYQFRWRFEHASPWLGYLGTAWGVEGAATLFSMEMVREALGVPFLSDFTVGAYASADPFLLMQLYTSQIDEMTSGYVPAASFLRDQLQRLVEAGVPFDDAIAEVIVGSLEGWWGINEEGLARGRGLTDRMRSHLGQSWNPVDGLLDWTMSQAADNLTSNAYYQNRTVRTPVPSTSLAIIPPHAAIGPGTARTVRRPPGNTGVFRLEDAGGGTFRGTARVSGAGSSDLEWLILRIQ